MSETLLLQVACGGVGCIALENINPELKSPPGWLRVERVEIVGETEQGTQVRRMTENFCGLPCLVSVLGKEYLETMQSADPVMAGKIWEVMPDNISELHPVEAANDSGE